MVNLAQMQMAQIAQEALNAEEKNIRAMKESGKEFLKLAERVNNDDAPVPYFYVEDGFTRNERGQIYVVYGTGWSTPTNYYVREARYSGSGVKCYIFTRDNNSIEDVAHGKVEYDEKKVIPLIGDVTSVEEGEEFSDRFIKILSDNGYNEMEYY